MPRPANPGRPPELWRARLRLLRGPGVSCLAARPSLKRNPRRRLTGRVFNSLIEGWALIDGTDTVWTAMSA